MTLAKKTECRAVDPRYCRNHGVSRKLETATATHDFDAYLEARQEKQSDETFQMSWMSEILPELYSTIKLVERTEGFSREYQAVSSDDSRVQNGEVFDEIDLYEAGRKEPHRLSRHREGIMPADPNILRIQTSIPLSPATAMQLTSGLMELTAVKFKPPVMDTPYSFLLPATVFWHSLSEEDIFIQDLNTAAQSLPTKTPVKAHLFYDNATLA